jgi:predicted dehydrogenase
MGPVRIGIVGLGTMGAQHARTLLEGKVSRAVLTAVSDISAEACGRFPDVRSFATSAGMFRSGEVDAVVIATPHFSHVPEGIAALEAGLHVLVEKPLAVHKADGERLLAAQRGQIFAEMFNQRTDPLFAKLRALVAGGELGEVARVQWTVTDWFRPAAYYRSSGWRATWAGEGGGVLLNQCPHNLDLWQWIFGQPDRVRAFARFGRYHDIEVEDDVTGYFEYDSGTTGVFIASTGEAPGTNRLEVAAERGRVVIEGGKMSFLRNEVPMSEFSRNAAGAFDKPAAHEIEMVVEGSAGGHAAVLANFVEAILDGAPLLAPATEGVRSVELANAMLLSSSTGETIALPLDGARYEAWLNERIAQSKKNSA